MLEIVDFIRNYADSVDYIWTRHQTSLWKIPKDKLLIQNQAGHIESGEQAPEPLSTALSKPRVYKLWKTYYLLKSMELFFTQALFRYSMYCGSIAGKYYEKIKNQHSQLPRVCVLVSAQNLRELNTNFVSIPYNINWTDRSTNSSVLYRHQNPWKGNRQNTF